MKGNLKIITIICLILSGCQHKNSNQAIQTSAYADTVSYKTIDINIEAAVAVSNIFKPVSIINFDNNVENILGFPQNMTVRNDTIFAIDPYQSPGVYAYDMTGKQLFAYCHRGNGPEDLESPSCLAVTDTGISVYDDKNYRIMFFDKSGNFMWGVKRSGFGIGCGFWIECVLY